MHDQKVLNFLKLLPPLLPPPFPRPLLSLGRRRRLLSVRHLVRPRLDEAPHLQALCLHREETRVILLQKNIVEFSKLLIQIEMQRVSTKRLETWLRRWCW